MAPSILLVGYVSTDSELVDVLHTAIATVKELERGWRDAAGLNDRAGQGGVGLSA